MPGAAERVCVVTGSPINRGRGARSGSGADAKDPNKLGPDATTANVASVSFSSGKRKDPALPAGKNVVWELLQSQPLGSADEATAGPTRVAADPHAKAQEDAAESAAKKAASRRKFSVEMDRKEAEAAAEAKQWVKASTQEEQDFLRELHFKHTFTGTNGGGEQFGESEMNVAAVSLITGPNGARTTRNKSRSPSKSPGKAKAVEEPQLLKPLVSGSSSSHYYVEEKERRSREKVEYALRGGRPPALFECDDPAEVCPYLYIGSMQSSCAPILRRHNIQAVVNACAMVTSTPVRLQDDVGSADSDPRGTKQEVSQYDSDPHASSTTASEAEDAASLSSHGAGRMPTFSLALSDHPKSALSRTAMDDLVAFVDRARSEKKTVLIYCARGVSRCATVCCWYLLASRVSSSLASALTMVARNRPIVDPNKGFRKQLKDLEVEIASYTALGDKFLKIADADRRTRIVEAFIKTAAGEAENADSGG
eukprot:g4063.t1